MIRGMRADRRRAPSTGNSAIEAMKTVVPLPQRA